MQNINARTDARPRAASLRLVPLGLAPLGLMLAASAPAGAQTLSLSPVTSTAGVGGTVLFSVSLNPASGGSGGLFSYDTNIFVNSTYLQFVGSAPYTPSSVSLADFPNSEATTNVVSQSGGSTDLRITFDNNNSDAAIAAPTVLGTFSVRVLAALPAGGTAVTFGPADTGSGATANQGGSELLANFTTEALRGVSGATVSPAAAPEPSGLLPLFGGAAGLGLLAWRRRRTA